MLARDHGNGQEAAELSLNIEARCQLHVREAGSGWCQLNSIFVSPLYQSYWSCLRLNVRSLQRQLGFMDLPSPIFFNLFITFSFQRS